MQALADDNSKEIFYTFNNYSIILYIWLTSNSLKELICELKLVYHSVNVNFSVFVYPCVCWQPSGDEYIHASKKVSKNCLIELNFNK